MRDWAGTARLTAQGEDASENRRANRAVPARRERAPCRTRNRATRLLLAPLAATKRRCVVSGKLLDDVDWLDEFAYVRAYYGVPAKRGTRVTICGKPGRITSGAGNYIRVLMDGERKPGIYHPTWRVDYLSSLSAGSSR